MVAVVFKDLQKLVSHSQQENTRKELFQRLQDKHKLEDIKTNGDCCYNHIIGLPTKEGVEKAMFDYEKILYDSLFDNESNTLNHASSFKHRHLWVKKATGLGVTEFS